MSWFRMVVAVLCVLQSSASQQVVTLDSGWRVSPAPSPPCAFTTKLEGMHCLCSLTQTLKLPQRNPNPITSPEFPNPTLNSDPNPTLSIRYWKVCIAETAALQTKHVGRL